MATTWRVCVGNGFYETTAVKYSGQIQLSALSSTGVAPTASPTVFPTANVMIDVASECGEAVVCLTD